MPNELHVTRNIKNGHVGGLDSVRALAALSVVFAHIIGPELPAVIKNIPFLTNSVVGFSQYIFTGHPAVIAFFVVSGFCIHYPYISKPLPVLSFWSARLVRIIMPALAGMILAKIGGLNDYNIQDGYILWSVVCELYYYALYPILLWVSMRVPWRFQYYISLSLSFLVALIVGSNQYGSAHIYGPMLNWIVALPSWIAGCVLAENINIYNREHSSVNYSKIISWRIMMALVASLLYWATMNTSFGYYLTMNGFALLVYFWIRVEIRSRNGSESGLESIGKWSYSIYLYHMPLLLIFNQLLRPIWSIYIMFLCIPVVLYGANWLYRKVEIPSHAYARRMYNSIKHRGFFIYPSASYDSKTSRDQ